MRRAGDLHADRGQEELIAGAGLRRFGLDLAVVPALLLLLARDLLVLDPPRVLAWRLLHDPQLASLGGWLAALVPRPHPSIDRDPIALLLATAAVAFAAAYLAGGLLGLGTRFRVAILASSAAVLVIAPSLGFMAMGHALGRPYGQDGGVVQLPLALDKILAGESPYAADYSQSILAREARASRFWAERGGNPILRHHAYLPGTHLLMMPMHLVCRAAGVTFDPRTVTLLAYVLAAWLATRLVAGADRQLCAAAVVLVNPLVYWHQIFGANDIVFVAMLLAAAGLIARGRATWGAVVLGAACGTKQLAWPFAPFLLLVAAGVPWPIVDWRGALVRFARLGLVAAAVFAAVVLPVAALDFRAFHADIVGYNVGLPGADNYPLGGTPGFGFANYLIYFGAVDSLADYVPFSLFYLLLVPFGLLMARAAARRGDVGTALAMGGAALLASLYFSRVVHPNYLLPLAVLLPVGALGASLAADVALVPLLLGAVAVEVAQQSPLRLLWEDAVAARVPAFASGLTAALMPRAGPALTDDPLSLVWSATAAAFALAALGAGVLGAGVRVRAMIAAAAVVFVAIGPAWVVVRLSERTGLVRAQDEWVVAVRASSDRLTGSSAGAPAGREAWSTSFREEPPRRLDVEAGRAPVGSVALAALLRPVARDPRIVCIIALAVLAALVMVRSSRAAALAAAAVLVSPAVAGSAVFGGGHAVGAIAAVAIVAGVRRTTRGPALVRILLAVAVPVLAAAFFGGPSLWGAVGPGYGIANLWTAWGALPGSTLLIGAAMLALAVSVHAARSAAPVAWAAALSSMLLLMVAPAAAPDAVLTPLALLAFAATRGD